MLIFPLLLLFGVGRAPAPPAATLADFSRFSKAINQQIAIVELDGTVREGILEAAADDQVSVRFGSGTKIFSRASVASAERMRDGRGDGAIKGAIFGGLLGLLTLGAYGDGYTGDRAGYWLGSVAVYSGIGYALDAPQTHREPIYRSPAAPAPTPNAAMTLSFRF